MVPRRIALTVIDKRRRDKCDVFTSTASREIWLVSTWSGWHGRGCFGKQAFSENYLCNNLTSALITYANTSRGTREALQTRRFCFLIEISYRRTIPVGIRRCERFSLKTNKNLQNHLNNQQSVGFRFFGGWLWASRFHGNLDITKIYFCGIRGWKDTRKQVTAASESEKMIFADDCSKAISK